MQGSCERIDAGQFPAFGLMGRSNVDRVGAWMTLPVEFVLFGLTLLAVALTHKYALQAALIGLGVIAAWKVGVAGFPAGAGFAGLVGHLKYEWVILANLLALLVSFALLARHFEASRVPEWMPALLPDDWKGGFVLLVLIFVLSSILDNIAAALIGGTVALRVFSGRVHIGYVAAIVAASNGGGSGSVLGDTTTTMMWIAGKSPWSVLTAYAAAIPALVVFGVPASLQQHRFSPIEKDAASGVVIDWGRIGVVAVILLTAVAVNIWTNLYYPAVLDHFPVLGVAVFVVVVVTSLWRRADWFVVPDAAKGAVFLLALVAAASMMPVERLPPPSVAVTFGMGVLSAVFDNIPLTALALKQGGFDWGLLAYAVGFGGSMMWFGSSAGVAITRLFPEAQSADGWLKGAWHVPLAYVVGFGVQSVLTGWHP